MREHTAPTVVLTRAHRSTQRILRVATAVVAPCADRLPKQLVCVNPEGDRVRRFAGDDDVGEAEKVARRLRRDHEEQGVPWSSMAVLVRRRRQAAPLVAALAEAGIPVRLVGKVGPGSGAAQALALAYLRLAVHPDDAAVLRTLKVKGTPDVGNATCHALVRLSLKHQCSLWALLLDQRHQDRLPARARPALQRYVTVVRALRARPPPRARSQHSANTC